MVYGTMIMEDDQQDNDEDEDQYADYGTMIYEAPPTEDKEDQDELQSLFESNDRINSVVQIPDDPSREDLEEMCEELKSLFQQDLEKLQNYYSTNIAFVQKRINQMD